jgi:hypothetical protein
LIIIGAAPFARQRFSFNNDDEQPQINPDRRRHIRVSRGSKPVKKFQKSDKKKLASRWPFPLDRKFERQTVLFGRSKKVQKK